MSQGRLDKREGSYYTPPAVAMRILSLSGYWNDADIINKKIIDPSAGDGAIMIFAAQRLAVRLNETNMSTEMKAQIACNCLYAIEINEAELAKCRKNVANVLAKNGINIETDDLVHFVCADTTKIYKDYIGQMDYVVGNPPYVRIHNLTEKPDSKYIDGMCDLYYAFFDYGQQMLKNNGILTFISPSSWFASKSGTLMRQDLEERKAIKTIYDYGHTQIFAPYATTYTAITVLTKTKNKEILIADEAKKKNANQCWNNGYFFPSCHPDMEDILCATGNVTVHNGYATNLDSLYFSNTPRGFGSLEHKAVKASTCEEHYMLYPYKNAQLLSLDEIKNINENAYELLTSNEKALRKRNKINQKQWWQFARSQGITDTEIERVAMQNIIKPGQPIRTMIVHSGEGVYSGIYVIGLTQEELDTMLDDDYILYVTSLRHYKNGGYYSIGSKEIEKYLNWRKQNKK